MQGNLLTYLLYFSYCLQRATIENQSRPKFESLKLKLSGIDSLEKAKEVMEDFIFENSEDNGDRPLLLELESYFLNGLFEASNIQVEITEKETLNILWRS